jgi:hypothetical protein
MGFLRAGVQVKLTGTPFKAMENMRKFGSKDAENLTISHEDN